jgi:hypothetical protein
MRFRAYQEIRLSDSGYQEIRASGLKNSSLFLISGYSDFPPTDLLIS